MFELSSFSKWLLLPTTDVVVYRVMTDGRERYSLPLFFDPDYYTPIECLPTCQSAENPAKFPPVKSGEYTLGRYADTHNSYDSKEEA